jgi:SulP family sulfate permease
MGRMQYIDQSGLYALEDMLIDLEKNGITVLLVDLLKQPRYMMERIDIIPDLISEEHIFSNFNDCLTWIKSNINDNN